MAKRMIIRKHATRQHELPNIVKMSSWHAISKVPKLFEHTTYVSYYHKLLFAEK
jgi:hypothetical protein